MTEHFLCDWTPESGIKNGGCPGNRGKYQDWRDRLPDSLQGSGLGTKLDEAIERLAEIAETLADIDLPKGFGRD